MPRCRRQGSAISLQEGTSGARLAGAALRGRDPHLGATGTQTSRGGRGFTGSQGAAADKLLPTERISSAGEPLLPNLKRLAGTAALRKAGREGEAFSRE